MTSKSVYFTIGSNNGSHIESFACERKTFPVIDAIEVIEATMVRRCYDLSLVDLRLSQRLDRL